MRSWLILRRPLAAWRRPCTRLALALGLVVAVQVSSAPAEADGSAPGTGNPPAAEFHPNIKPTLDIRRATGPITIDGELDDPGWQDAARATNFTETNPGTMVRPPVETEALLAYDDRNLYIAFIAADDDPSSIRSMLRGRDDIFQDDYIGILFDTFGDNRSAYEIFVNPIGCQGDLRMTRGGDNEDIGFDLVFESRGKITPRGYQVELAIPFKSLRFPGTAEQTWRATFWRTHPRENRSTYAWAATSRDEPCFTCQFGTLTGIRNVSPGGTLDLIPAVLGNQAGGLDHPGDSTRSWHNDAAESQLSLTGRYALTSDLTAEAAVNPDFSQVESDPGQIDVNATYALSFSEHRPFFQEGSDLFNTWIDAVYTRAINEPDVAAKISGQSGKTSVAWLVARDHRSPALIPFEEHSEAFEGGPSTSNIVRLRRSLREESHVGFLATDRHMAGGWGSVAGVDGSLRFARNYVLQGQFLASHTREPDDPAITEGVGQATFEDGHHTSAFDGESFGGSALYAGVERSARHWNVNSEWIQFSPAFRADNGLVTQNDTRHLDVWTGYNMRPTSRWLTRIEPNIDVGRVWNWDGLRKDEWLSPAIEGQFRWQTSAGVNYLWSDERFRGARFPGIRRWNTWAESNFSRVMSAGFSVRRGRSIARNLATPVLGRESIVEAWATLKPGSRLVIEPNLSYAKMEHPETDTHIYEGYILRTRIGVQWTRELSMRLVTQYDDFDRSLSIEPLVTYRVNPFSAIYAGSTHHLRDVDHGGGPNQVSRQLFFKLQYLFRI